MFPSITLASCIKTLFRFTPSVITLIRDNSFFSWDARTLHATEKHDYRKEDRKRELLNKAFKYLVALSHLFESDDSQLSRTVNTCSIGYGFKLLLLKLKQLNCDWRDSVTVLFLRCSYYSYTKLKAMGNKEATIYLRREQHAYIDRLEINWRQF